MTLTVLWQGVIIDSYIPSDYRALHRTIDFHRWPPLLNDFSLTHLIKHFLTTSCYNFDIVIYLATNRQKPLFPPKIVRDFWRENNFLSIFGIRIKKFKIVTKHKLSLTDWPLILMVGLSPAFVIAWRLWGFVDFSLIQCS